MAIRVNMLRFRVSSDLQARSKNGQPDHSTTGLARTNCTQLDVCSLQGNRRAAMWLPISSPNTGAASTRPIQKRRLMSPSSAFGPVSPVAVTGSRAMPQIGHGPGPTWRIWGCMGQV